MGNLSIAATAAAFALLLSGPVQAQSGDQNPCDLADPPYPLTEANRLDERRLAERFAGKTFVVQRRLLQNLPPPKKRSFERVMTYYFRPDGSLRTTCQHRRQPGSDLKPCEGFGPSASRSAENATDIATWRIDGGRMCWHRSKNERELCFFVHEADGRGYVRLDRGRRVSCFEGELTFN